MSTPDALTQLIQTRDLSPEIAAALNLNPEAVASFGKLPEGTQQGMIDRLIDRFSEDLGGSWLPQK